MSVVASKYLYLATNILLAHFEFKIHSISSKLSNVFEISGQNSSLGAQRVMHSSASIQAMQDNIEKMRKEYESLTSKDQNGREGNRLKNLIKLTLKNIESPVVVSKGEERRQKTIEKYSKLPGFSFLTENNNYNGNGLATSSGAHHDVHVPSSSFRAQLDIVGNSEPETDAIPDIENPQPDLEIVIRLNSDHIS